MSTRAENRRPRPAAVAECPLRGHRTPSPRRGHLIPAADLGRQAGRAAIAALLVLLAPAGRAAEGGLAAILASRPSVDRAVTPEEAGEIARRESPMVAGMAAEADAAAGRLRAARAERLPWLSANALAAGGSNPGIVAGPPVTQPQAIMAVPGGGFGDVNATLMVPLYTSGRVEAMVRGAAAGRAAAQGDLSARQQDAALMARAAAYDVLAKRAMVAVQEARLKQNRERLAQDQARFAQQQVPEYYVRRGEAEVAAAGQDLTNAQRDVDIALAALKTAMGANPASRLDVVGALPDPDLDATLPSLRIAAGEGDHLTALLRLAEANRPELKSADERVRAAGAEASAVRASFGPQVNVSLMADAMRMRGGEDRGGMTAAVMASVPLYSGGLRQGRVSEAEGMRRRAEADRQQAALQAAQDIQAALLTVRAASSNVAAADTAVTAAQAEYAAVQMRYQVGRSIVTEVLDAQASLTRAGGDAVQARYSYAVARDSLLRAVGLLNGGR